ncbi:hypothetical protein ACSLVK_18885 [Photorhabdus tasmaniensis]|uniref:hypothetical protein n=1 Tax=Photorhabdus tasmaniensis TaxID=1004159 RepID=UPI004042B8B5
MPYAAFVLPANLTGFQMPDLHRKPSWVVVRDDPFLFDVDIDVALHLRFDN